MATNFGPWTTGIHAGSPQKLLLSAHWNRRLALLAPTRRLAATVSGRTWGAVLAAGLLLGFVPAVRAVPGDGDKKVAKPAADKPAAKKHRPGFLYAFGIVSKEGRPFGLRVVRIDPATGKWRKIADEETSALRISPDRQTAAYSHKGAVWTSGTDGSSPGKFTDVNGVPCWSPDGKSMIVSHTRPKPGKKDEWIHETYRVNEDGTIKTLLNLPKTFRVQDWSPDGKWLLRSSRTGLWMITPDGKTKKHLPKAKGWVHPRFSPDGKQIAFERQWKGVVRVTDVDGKKIRTIFGPTAGSVTFAPCWSPDGKQVATTLWDKSADGALSADPKETHPRITLIDVKTGKHRILKLTVVKGVTFQPFYLFDWR